MMTNQELVAELDALIDRYQRARIILASLQNAVKVPALQRKPRPAATAVSDTIGAIDPPATPEIQVKLLPPKQRRERTLKVRPQTIMPNALSASVPSAAVVVSAAELSRQKQATERVIERTEKAILSAGSLESLVREIAARQLPFAAPPS